MSWFSAVEAIPTRLNRASFSSCKFKTQSQSFPLASFPSFQIDLAHGFAWIPNTTSQFFCFFSFRGKKPIRDRSNAALNRAPSSFGGNILLLLNSNLGAAGSMSNMLHCF
ncbi:hypothetical protein VNO80_17063 [Phaseolus coccineus]|uniref:Uncharacterized protein n=1 Tax=Phaseolus coccineus TaxID=3886 RepID=A0AAN9R3A9_PHACN